MSLCLVGVSYGKETKCGCWAGIRGKEGRGRPVYLGWRLSREGMVSPHVLPSSVFSGMDLSPCAGSWSWGSCPLSLSRVAGQSVRGSKFRPVKVSGGLAERSLVSDTGTRPRLVWRAIGSLRSGLSIV